MRQAGQLPLRPRVLAVGGDHLEAIGVQLLDQLLDERHVRVPRDVEDVVALEQQLVVVGQQVELRLVADQRLVAERTGALQLLAPDAPRQRLERGAVGPGGVADPARRGLAPGHHRGRLQIGQQQLVAVGDLLVVERAADHVRPAVQHGNAAVHVQPGLGVAVGALDRHHLGTAGAVHVGQLEPHEADPLSAPSVEHLSGAGRGVSGHLSLLPHAHPDEGSGVPLSQWRTCNPRAARSRSRPAARPASHTQSTPPSRPSSRRSAAAKRDAGCRWTPPPAPGTCRVP